MNRFRSRMLFGSLGFAAIVACGSNGTEASTKPAEAPSSGQDASAQPTSGGGDAAAPSSDASTPDGSAASLPTPRFTSTATYSTIVAGSNDPMDVIYPNPADLATGTYKFPLVVFIQGANVDKANYTSVAETVAKYGFVVAIPNHQRTVLVLTGLFPEPSSVVAAFAHLVTEGARDAAPIHNVVDTAKYGLLGHSFGSVVGLDLIAQSCTQPICPGAFTSPPQLRGGAFYGASRKGPAGGMVAATDNRGLGAMLVQGTVDGANAPADAKATFDKISGPPRAYVTVTGANHYGITNMNNPSGAAADRQTATLAQAASIEAIGRWSALFLLATVSGDAAAKNALAAGKGDPNVTVQATF